MRAGSQQPGRSFQASPSASKAGPSSQQAGLSTGQAGPSSSGAGPSSVPLELERLPASHVDGLLAALSLAMPALKVNSQLMSRVLSSVSDNLHGPSYKTKQCQPDPMNPVHVLNTSQLPHAGKEKLHTDVILS